MRRSQVNSQARAHACTFNTASAAAIAIHHAEPLCEAHQPAAMDAAIRLRTQLRCSRANMIDVESGTSGGLCALYAGAMSQWTRAIVVQLTAVQDLRRQRDADPGLLARVLAVKRFQHVRFMRDYAALLADARYGQAARFFLDELYGPVDFAARDAEFERVVPWMARMLPDEVMRTIANLIELHSLTEELDQQMAAVMSSPDLDERSYRVAWLRVGRRTDRERQLLLLLAAGRALDRYTRSKILAATLRIMRGPAQAAGLARLQSFLEGGMSAFASMAGAAEFLRAIEDNESRTISDLFVLEKEKPD
jgi:hypothetical protein